mgnify:CR=1 FL=1
MNDFTLGDILHALLGGLQWTAILSLTAFVLGSCGGLIILALRLAHRPDSAQALSPQHPARQRLALDELLASQLALRLVRARMRRLPGHENAGDGRLVSAIEAALRAVDAARKGTG